MTSSQTHSADAVLLDLHAEAAEILAPHTRHMSAEDFDALVSETVENHVRALSGDWGFLSGR